MSPQPFRVLAVCHANHCRSPIVEHLLRRAADAARLGWVVTSAGTHARPGQPCHPYTSRVLIERGVDASDFRSTALAAAGLAGADLVLTADLEQRRQVAALDPTAVPRTFPLLAMAAWLAQSPPPARGHAAAGGLIELALAGRSRSQPLSSEQQVLRDPLGRGLRHFRRCADEVEQAVGTLVGHAAGRST